MQIIKKRQNGKTTIDSPVNQESIDQGEGSSESVVEISQKDLLESLDQLNSQFQEFEKIREEIKTRISSIAKIVPKLTERKHFLQNHIDEKRKEAQQLDRQIPDLTQQKETLLQSIPQKQEEKARLEKQIRLEQDKVKEIKKLITKLTRDRKKIEKSMQRKQDEITKLDEYITQIKSIQEYGLDLVSTLVYASKKR